MSPQPGPPGRAAAASSGLTVPGGVLGSGHRSGHAAATTHRVWGHGSAKAPQVVPSAGGLGAPQPGVRPWQSVKLWLTAPESTFGASW